MMKDIQLNKEESFEDFFKSLERSELSEEQQILLSSYGGDDQTITVNNSVSGCSVNNCQGGNCSNCVKGCGAS